jgi:hypothetical protein
VHRAFVVLHQCGLILPICGHSPPGHADYLRAAILRPAIANNWRAAICRPAMLIICARPFAARPCRLFARDHLPPGHAYYLRAAIRRPAMPFICARPSRARPFACCAAAIRRRFLSRSAICLLRCGHSLPISLALGHLPIALRPFAADFPCARPCA